MTWAVGGILAAILVASVVYLIKRVISKETALGQQEAALLVEQEHAAALERAAAAQRAERAKVFDEKASKVSSPGDAVDLLRGSFARTRIADKQVPDSGSNH